jgi:hypothetical protein
LALSGSTAAGSAVAVNSGGTLAGSGTVSGPLTLASGGVLVPTAGSAPLTLRGNVSLAGGGALTFGLSSVAQAQLNLVGGGANTLAGPGSGTVTINLLDLNSSVAANTTYTLVSVVGSFGGVSNWSLAAFTLNAPVEWSQSFLTFSGNSLSVDVIPEPPATGVLAAVAAWSLLRRRRRPGSAPGR